MNSSLTFLGSTVLGPMGVQIFHRGSMYFRLYSHSSGGPFRGGGVGGPFLTLRRQPYKENRESSSGHTAFHKNRNTSPCLIKELLESRRSNIALHRLSELEFGAKPQLKCETEPSEI